MFDAAKFIETARRLGVSHTWVYIKVWCKHCAKHGPPRIIPYTSGRTDKLPQYCTTCGGPVTPYEHHWAIERLNGESFIDDVMHEMGMPTGFCDVLEFDRLARKWRSGRLYISPSDISCEAHGHDGIAAFPQYGKSSHCSICGERLLPTRQSAGADPHILQCALDEFETYLRHKHAT